MWKSNIRFCFTLEIKESPVLLSIWVFFSIFKNVFSSLAKWRTLNVIILTADNTSAWIKRSYGRSILSYCSTVAVPWSPHGILSKLLLVVILKKKKSAAV